MNLKSFMTGCLALCLSSMLAMAEFAVVPEPVSVKEEEGVCTRPLIVERKIDRKLPKEGYKLSIGPKGVVLFYGDKAGEFYGEQTMEQIRMQYAGKPVPCAEITDYPRYEWRGMLLDPARYFLPLDDMKRFIDVMAFYKYNKLHVHLTDDQGWRLPVPGYPKLKEIASHRAESHGNKTPHGGMYTKEELKELVRYAAQKHVEVIPEVDAPGHNQALGAAYPNFMCFPSPDLKVGTTAGVTKHLVCPQNPEVWAFYKAVMKELKEIFPSSYVHLGGDEAPEDNWMKCPACAKWRKANGIAVSNGEGDALKQEAREQLRVFFRKLSGIVREQGKEPLFWYEDPIADYPKGSTVYTWRMGLTPSTIKKSREQGLKLICSPGEHCYLDYSYGQTSLKRSYDLDPGYGLPEKDQKHIIGLEATMWGEHIPDIDRAFYMAYPRALALSEAGWSPMDVRGWDRFKKKLPVQADIMKKKWQLSLDRPDPTSK